MSFSACLKWTLALRLVIWKGLDSFPVSTGYRNALSVSTSASFSCVSEFLASTSAASISLLISSTSLVLKKIMWWWCWLSWPHTASCTDCTSLLLAALSGGWETNGHLWVPPALALGLIWPSALCGALWSFVELGVGLRHAAGGAEVGGPPQSCVAPRPWILVSQSGCWAHPPTHIYITIQKSCQFTAGGVRPTKLAESTLRILLGLSLCQPHGQFFLKGCGQVTDLFDAGCFYFCCDIIWR